MLTVGEIVCCAAGPQRRRRPRRGRRRRRRRRPQLQRPLQRPRRLPPPLPRPPPPPRPRSALPVPLLSFTVAVWLLLCFEAAPQLSPACERVSLLEPIRWSLRSAPPMWHSSPQGDDCDCKRCRVPHRELFGPQQRGARGCVPARRRLEERRRPLALAPPNRWGALC